MALGLNFVSYMFLIRPLTKEEVERQWQKRQAIGKFNYSLDFLDLKEDKIEWEAELEKNRLPKPESTGEEVAAHHH